MVATIKEAQKIADTLKITINVVRILAEEAGYVVTRLNKYENQHNTVGLVAGKYTKEFKDMRSCAEWLERTLDTTQFN